QKVREHPQAVAHDVNLRRRIMRPAHRHFDRAQPVPPRKKKNLRVKTKALDALLFKNDPTAPPDEDLEATLCIFEQHSRKKPHQAVECDPCQLAEVRLSN